MQDGTSGLNVGLAFSVAHTIFLVILSSALDSIVWNPGLFLNEMRITADTFASEAGSVGPYALKIYYHGEQTAASGTIPNDQFLYQFFGLETNTNPSSHYQAVSVP